MTIQKPVVLGMGNVGKLVAVLLRELGMEVTGVDQAENPPINDINYISADISDKNTLSDVLKGADAVISCLPFFLTLNVAEIAHQKGIHYFDPTEDVKSTTAIRKLAETSKAVMIPQNGLAPGFIGIVGSHLAKKFDDGSLRHIKLRVGALPQHPIGQLGYAGNWSLVGLVNEYTKECDVIEDGKRKQIPALKHQEILRIDGVEYEAFTTSGGLGTMTETFLGKVEELNYKSIRYPGHLAGMKLLIEEMRFKDEPEELVKRIGNALPPDEQDRVLIHASVQGEIKGKLLTKELVTDYKPIEIAGKTRTAIAWTTATSIAAVVEMVSNGTLPQKGFVKQEDIPLEAFLATKSGSLYATNHPTLGEVLNNESAKNS